MSKTPLVSFVVPCYNYAQYLPDCLSSIFTQEGGYDFEVIAVDDGSTDNTREILSSYADPRLRIIVHPVNRGHVATINEGLGQARGDFVARIDPDDRYRPHFLSAVLEVFRTYPEVGLVYGDVVLIDDQGHVAAGRSDRVHCGQDFKGNEFVALLSENFICSPTVIARREAWQETLPVPAGLAFHDWYFTLMMARKHEFYYLNRVLAEYRVHSANHHTKIARDKSEEASIFRLLDQIYSEPEIDPSIEAQKQRAKRSVYGAQYLTSGNKYFGFHIDSDARRCYFQALRYEPRYAFRPDVFRRVGATLIGRKAYEVGKSVFRVVFQPR